MRLYNEDCLKVMKELETNSIDLLFCDLPYGETSCQWDCLIDLDEFWKEVNRICKDTTPMFFTCSTKFGVTLINSNPKQFRYDLVWIKSAPCGFLNARKMPMRKHEMVYVFYKKLPLYDLSGHTHRYVKKVGKYDRLGNVYEQTQKKEGTSIVGKYDPPLPTSVIKYDVPGKSNSTYGDVNRERFGHLKVSYKPPLPNSILEIASEKGKHPTQKPVGLIEFCLKYYSKEGDTILDPTMGSGSTGVACKNMNRHFIGIEMNKEIYDIANKRLQGDLADSP